MTAAVAYRYLAYISTAYPEDKTPNASQAFALALSLLRKQAILEGEGV